MKKTFRQLAIVAMTVLPTSVAMAQQEVEASVQADVVSHYMWRGQDRGGISIQPQGEVRWQGLSLGLQGNAGVESVDPHEINLSLGYSIAGFNIGVTDYWTTGVDPENRYFYFDKDKTPHQFEGNIGYTCPYFSLQGYTMFWGNDFKKNGDRAYSTYIELGIPFKLGGIDWMLTGGFTPMESAGEYYQHEIDTPLGPTTVQSARYDYAEGFAMNSASLRATKNLFLGDVRVPIFAELHTNPYLQTARLLFGFSIIPF